MTKYISIMLLAIVFATTTSKAQMIPQKPITDSRTQIQYVNDYILDHKDYYTAFINLVNEGLLARGNQTTFTDKWINYICVRMHSEYKTIYGFRNYYRKDGKIIYKIVPNYTGIVWVFDYEGCSIDIIKYDCGNLIFVPPTVRQINRAPVASQNNVTTVYVTAAPTYKQPKTTKIEYHNSSSTKAGWNVSVSGGGMQQCLGSAINGDYLGAAVAGFGSLSIGMTPSSESSTNLVVETTGQENNLNFLAAGLPNNMPQNLVANSPCSSSQRHSCGGPFVNGFCPHGHSTWN